jgi:hypothetical protein
MGQELSRSYLFDARLQTTYTPTSLALTARRKPLRHAALRMG